jgi:HPt (histidine-containing phosphotransfer) domain-containing protein
MSSGFDRSVLDKLVALGGATLIHSLFDLFEGSVPGRLEAILRAMKDGDLEQVAEEVHVLKSNGGNLGFTEVYRLGHAIETAIRSGGENPSVAELVEELDLASRSALAEIPGFRAEFPISD